MEKVIFCQFFFKEENVHKRPFFTGKGGNIFWSLLFDPVCSYCYNLESNKKVNMAR